MLFWRPPPGESNRFFVVDLFRGEEWGCCGVVCGGGCVEVDESGGGRQASVEPRAREAGRRNSGTSNRREQF